MDNKDPVLYEGVFAIAKPQDGKAVYQVARNSKGDVVVVAPERVEEPTLNEQELAKFSTQLVRARQGELQGQLMQALREKHKSRLIPALLIKMIQKKVRLTGPIEMSFIINF